MVEAKVIEKIRAVLIANTTVNALVLTRVYGEHISNIVDPKFPAISLALMPGQARTDVTDMVNMMFQIDLWFPVDRYTVDDVLACYGTIRSLLHKQSFSDATIGVKIMQMVESGIGPVMYDSSIRSHHLPARYAVVAI